jgi:tetratricopeptide (TPR) repeat protein
MKRSNNSTVGLKHIAFFEAIAEAEEKTPEARSATAGLLMLRLIDHWMLAGSVMVEPESVSVRSVRGAIMELEANDPGREVLLGMVNTMQTVREVDIAPMLPRLFAYAGCLEKRAELKLAADVYGTIARLGEEDYDGDLLIDSYLRLGYCQRMLGALNDAESAYSVAGKMAKRQKETARTLRSQIGTAIVVMARGNLPKADELLAQIALESEQNGCVEEQARALHANSTVARQRGDLGRSVRLAYGALQRTTLPNERDMILGDIGAAFITMRRFEAARDALMILDVTASTAVPKILARVNMVALAARAGNKDLFVNARARLEAVVLPPEAAVNFLIESARGYLEFGEPETAVGLLDRARELAVKHGFNRSIFEVDEMLNDRSTETRTTNDETPAHDWDSAADVEVELRKMALAVA